MSGFSEAYLGYAERSICAVGYICHSTAKHPLRSVSPTNSKKPYENNAPFRKSRSMLSMKTSIAIIVPAVSFSLAMINDRLSFRLPFPNLPSTALRSPISFSSWRKSSACFLPGGQALDRTSGYRAVCRNCGSAGSCTICQRESVADNIRTVSGILPRLARTPCPPLRCMHQS